jgi:hypothetical protein
LSATDVVRTNPDRGATPTKIKTVLPVIGAIMGA